MTLFYTATALPQPLTLDFPIFTTLNNNQAGSGLLVRANQYHFTSLYQKGRFSNIKIDFDVVHKQTSISAYQLTISDLFHQCDQQDLNAQTYMDQVQVEKGDQINNLGFPFFDGSDAFNSHRALIEFPIIATSSTEKSCYGVIAVSIREQI
ncbi:hypothetical protein [Vibrio atypicus]|uniref:hypothetical protein n=1 Tax=Vibrio atypicus TaxID=558271 RepID=UPI00135C7D9D|nr:hypothetical protein [Vibrio atypicus]